MVLKLVGTFRKEYSYIREGTAFLLKAGGENDLTRMFHNPKLREKTDYYFGEERGYVNDLCTIVYSCLHPIKTFQVVCYMDDVLKANREKLGELEKGRRGL